MCAECACVCSTAGYEPRILITLHGVALKLLLLQLSPELQAAVISYLLWIQKTQRPNIYIFIYTN